MGRATSVAPENQHSLAPIACTHDRGANVTALLQEEPRGERQPRRLLIVRRDSRARSDLATAFACGCREKGGAVRRA